MTFDVLSFDVLYVRLYFGVITLTKVIYFVLPAVFQGGIITRFSKITEDAETRRKSCRKATWQYS
jgi:hypothetical protein